jgi:hypothetical protein
LGARKLTPVVGSELSRLSEDERNAVVFEQNRQLALADALADSGQTFHRYVEAVATLSEEDLNDPSWFAQMPKGWRPCRILFDSGRQQGHAEGIRAWLARRGRDS